MINDSAAAAVAPARTAGQETPLEAAWSVSASPGAARVLGIPLAVVDLSGRWPDRYPAALLLVRPDQHVAWMGGADARPDELLQTVTGRVTAHQR